MKPLRFTLSSFTLSLAVTGLAAQTPPARPASRPSGSTAAQQSPDPASPPRIDEISPPTTSGSTNGSSSGSAPQSSNGHRPTPVTPPAAPGLRPTSKPQPSPDIDQLWLAPKGQKDRVAGAGTALAQFARGVQLQEKAAYEAALPLVKGASLADTLLAEYAQYYNGVIELRLSRLDNAAQTFAALAERQPQGYLSEATVLRQAEVAEADGRYADAIRFYEELSTRKTAAPDDILMRLAQAAKAAGDNERAATAWSRLYYEFPLSDLATVAATELGRMKEIQPIGPASARYKLELGRALRLFGSKRYAQARSSFELVQPYASGDDRELVALRLGECDFYLKRFRNARDAMRPFLDRASRRAEARFFHLTASRELGQRDEYVRLARKLVADHPESSWAEEALNNLGSHYLVGDDDQSAEQVFRELYEGYPKGPHAERAAWKFGWSAYKAGRYAETTRVFEKVAADFPHSDYRPAYLYWAGRAHEARGDRVSADACYSLAMADYRNSYYGRLAANRLGNRPVMPTPAASIDGEPAAEAASGFPPTAPLIRTLLSVELYDDASAELRYAQRLWGDSPVIQATLAWIAHQQGQFESGSRQFALLRGAITTMRRAYPQFMAAGGEDLPREILTVIFPLAYWDLIRGHAAQRSLDPYLVAALVAQESTFVPDIQSPAKAVGLMQLIPSTARQYARRLRLRYSASLLRNPEANIRMGTAYFADKLKQFGDVHLALASYNAGERPVRAWIAERPGLPRDEFIDDIPYPETQNYVKKILGTADDYRRLYGGMAKVPDAAPTVKSPTRAPGKPAAVSKPRAKKPSPRTGGERQKRRSPKTRKTSE